MIFQKELLLLCFLLGLGSLACKERVSILEPSDPEPKKETSSKAPPSCTLRTVEGKEICVQKREEIFYVDRLENQQVDFLFVLDVSHSMAEVLSRLGQSFESLMSSIKNTNWRMFFTTADHGDHFYEENLSTGEKVFSHQKWQDYLGSEPYFGRFMNLEHRGKKLDLVFLSAETPDYVQVFKDTLTRKPGDSCDIAPYCQRAMEQPLRALKASLERMAESKGSPTAPSLRENSTLISFIVTNEDERKEDPAHATSPEELLARFKELFPKKAWTSFGLLIKEDDSENSQNCLQKQRTNSPGMTYSVTYSKQVAKLAQLTEGENISLCETDYGPSLEKISRLLRGRIQSLSLKSVPLSDSIEVEFIKGQSQTGWLQDGQKLIFEEVLPPHSEIKVSYFVKTGPS